MVGPFRNLHGLDGKTSFYIVMFVSILLMMIIMFRLNAAMTPKSEPILPAATSQFLQADQHPRPQPNYLQHAAEGQAYLHKLLLQSSGHFDRLNADDQSFVDGVLGGRERLYFPRMYRGMKSNARAAGAASSKHERSGDTLKRKKV